MEGNLAKTSSANACFTCHIMGQLNFTCPFHFLYGTRSNARYMHGDELCFEYNIRK